jgi:formylmethanofuran dehydrogenase subunit E-like metal-binding protein
VKITDDYHAKVRLWAQKPTVVALPPGLLLPKFAARKFRTHEEMNQWKQSLPRELAQSAARHG